MSSQQAAAAVRAVDLARPEGLEGVAFQDLVRELIHRLSGIADDRADVRLLVELEHCMEPLLASCANRYSALHLQELLGSYCFWHPELPRGLQGEAVLELGAGSENPLALATATYLLGAAKAYGLERTPLISEVRQAKAIARIVYWLTMRRDLFPRLELAPFADVVAARASEFDLARLASGKLRLPDSVALLQASAASTGLPSGSVDRVVSAAFMEHPDDPEGVVAEIARITRPGGLSIHNIDTADHGIYGRVVDSPVAFLLEAEGEPMVRRCNRLRIGEFVRMFERHGFDLLKRIDYSNHNWTEAELAARVRPYSEMAVEELTTLRSVLVLRRQA